MMAIPLDASEASGVADVLEILAGLYAREISRETIDEVTSDEMVSLFALFGSDAPRKLQRRRKEVGDEALLEELGVEYTATFLGPGPHVGPYESLHRDDAPERTHWGPATADVNRFLREHELKLADDFTGFPDHIAVEFDIVAKLFRHYADSDDPNQSEQAMALARQFVADHLSRWLPAFVAEVEEQAESEFYADLARLTGVIADRFLFSDS